MVRRINAMVGSNRAWKSSLGINRSADESERGHQRDAAAVDLAQQPRQQLAVAGIVDMEFVNNQQGAVPQQRVNGHIEGAGTRRPGGRVLRIAPMGVQLAEQVVEMPALIRQVQGVEELLGQPALAPSHRTPQIETAARPGSGSVPAVSLAPASASSRAASCWSPSGGSRRRRRPRRNGRAGVAGCELCPAGWPQRSLRHAALLLPILTIMPLPFVRQPPVLSGQEPANSGRAPPASLRGSTERPAVRNVRRPEAAGPQVSSQRQRRRGQTPWPWSTG